MTTDAIEQQRREIYEIAEAVAPGWARWRARIEEVTTPVREWMLKELAPRSIGFGLLIERGHIPAPEPGAPGPFALASEQQTRALLEDAGFTAVRTEEVPVRFTFRDLDEYTTYATDTGGPAALVLPVVPDDEREALKTRLGAAFAPFGTDAGYEIPGLAICATAD